MTLEQWLDNAWIRRTSPTKHEVTALMQIAERELGDASVEALSSDGRFDHAYAAVRSMGQAALLASGFAVPKGSRQHERVIESIRFTLGDEWSTEVDYYDRCRRMRHQSMYDHSGVAQESDAQELVASAIRLFDALIEWLSDRHADLYDRRE